MLDSILIQMFICVMMADFITGLIHWIEDTYGLPSWPLIGKAVIEPNIIHHEQPGKLGSDSTFIGRNYQTVVPAVILVVVVTLFFGFIWQFALVCLLASFGNEVHTWNHRSKNPFWIKMLQDTAIIQTPAQHAKHHRKPYNVYFCTLTNVMNPILCYFRFWANAELVLSKLGFPVQRLCKERRGY